MTSWILILIVVHGVTSIEFSSERACLEAKATIDEKTRNNFYTICVAK